jgi:hypothetical protein
MGIFAISDLHLDSTGQKPMNVFGANWENHTAKIKINWGYTVAEDDTVLVPGDLSWAKTLAEAETDLRFINGLGGKIICVEGNHDYWWDGTNKLNDTYDNITFLRNTHVLCEGFGICGMRGWVLPDCPDFTAHDEKIYKRELNRLKLSLDSAMKAEVKKIIVMMHFPPCNQTGKSEFIDLMKNYPVKKVVYGHLHGNEFDAGIKGIADGIEYNLVSADFLDFTPTMIA